MVMFYVEIKKTSKKVNTTKMIFSLEGIK